MKRHAAAPLDVVLTFPGLHNAQNACAALILAEFAGVVPPEAVAACADFRGPARRFEILGERGGVAVVDDYAHHPTEVGAAIDAARQRYPGRRLIAIHTPHTYSRVSRLLDDYRRSFTGADLVIIGPIEEARERGMPRTVSSQDVADRADPADMRRARGRVERRGDRPGDANRTARRCGPGYVPRWIRQAGAAPPRCPGGTGCPRVTGSTRSPVCSSMSRWRDTSSSASAAPPAGSSPRETSLSSRSCCDAAMAPAST